MKLTEQQITEAITTWLGECDADDLATVVGTVFGGDCSTEDGEEYDFTPNENYCGAFGEA